MASERKRGERLLNYFTPALASNPHGAGVYAGRSSLQSLHQGRDAGAAANQVRKQEDMAIQSHLNFSSEEMELLYRQGHIVGDRGEGAVQQQSRIQNMSNSAKSSNDG